MKAPIWQQLKSNRDNVTAPIQFRRQFQHLKRGFWIKDRPINLHLNSITFIQNVN